MTTLTFLKGNHLMLKWYILVGIIFWILTSFWRSLYLMVHSAYVTTCCLEKKNILVSRSHHKMKRPKKKSGCLLLEWLCKELSIIVNLICSNSSEIIVVNTTDIVIQVKHQIYGQTRRDGPCLPQIVSSDTWKLFLWKFFIVRNSHD